MLVRGKRREEGWNVLIAKMVFSHHSGISLMVEQEISNLLVGVRFSHPAQNKLAYCIKFGIIQNGISRNHEEREMANKATTGRGGVLDDPAGWLTTGGKSPVGMAVSQIRVKSVCSKVNPEAETTRELDLSVRFATEDVSAVRWRCHHPPDDGQNIVLFGKGRNRLKRLLGGVFV